MQVYHMVRHNQSYQSMKCISNMIRSVYGESQFACSYTKASAIITGIFEPMIRTQIQNELKNAQFVYIRTDASNHNAIKMYPVIVRYFLPTSGTKTRLIEYTSMPSESAYSIFEMLQSAWEKWDIQEKLVAFCADNCSTYFGTVERGGQKNVFSRLKEAFGDSLIGIGCIAHIYYTMHLKTPAQMICRSKYKTYWFKCTSSSTDQPSKPKLWNDFVKTYQSNSQKLKVVQVYDFWQKKDALNQFFKYSMRSNSILLPIHRKTCHSSWKDFLVIRCINFIW